MTLKKFQPVLSAPNCVGRTEYCPSDDVTALFATTRIETRRFAQYSANPPRSLSLQWPIRLPLGQVPRDSLQRATLFRTLVQCALEGP